jgi:choline dehydrogenase-like flavoprotein
MNLTPAQFTTLRAATDALIPSLKHSPDPHGFYARAASDVEIAEKIAVALDKLSPQQQQEFTQLLDLLASPLLGLTWFGALKSVKNLTSEQREQMLLSWSGSSIGKFRQGFQALKKLSMFLYYGFSEDGLLAETQNPTWAAIGYPGPLSAPPDVPRPITTLEFAQDTTLSCDVVIVGSGAGGGVVAGELAEAGFDVVVVEKGNYFAERDFTQREATMIGELYESGGAYSTKNGSVSIFAGSCLGGGTTINWSGALRTPDYVLEEWSKNHANPHFTTPDYQRSFDAVEAATHVDTLESAHNIQNQALERGARALGYHTSTIPRNSNGCAVDNCQSCGYCSLGCQRGTKMSVLKTYLQQAFERGARFLANAEVEKITIEQGKATGVQVTIPLTGRKVNIKAKFVVVAAGSIHTPALLIRSGLQHPHIGRHLHLHPTVSVAGVYGEAVNAWHGNMMTALCNDFARQTGAWGVKLETPPIHSGLLGMAMPWAGGKAHKDAMRKAANVAGFIVLTRDRDGGRITADKRGQPVADYAISPFDLAHLQRGILEAAHIHASAGARDLYLPHNQTFYFDLTKGWNTVENSLRAMSTWKWRANDFPLFSAHQMGTCRMGGNRSTHPVSPEGETYEVKNLFVADSSPFPEASGANPMLSIQAMAHFTAQGLKNRFRG